MNVRQIRNQLKLTVSQLSHKTRIEEDQIRAYEYGTLEVNEIDRLKIYIIQKNLNAFVSMGIYESKCYAEFYKKTFNIV